MTFMFLNKDTRPVDYWLSEAVPNEPGVEVDLSEEFLERYREAVDLYDGVQAELELIYKSKEMSI